MTYTLTLTRLREDDKQTIGSLTLFRGYERLFSCYTLELPWRDNAPMTSCIPPGQYALVARYSERYNNHVHVTNVEGRSLILIHSGNFHRDTQGCILVGRDLVDLNRDGHLDVTSSVNTLRTLLALMTIKAQLVVHPVIEHKTNLAV